MTDETEIAPGSIQAYVTGDIRKQEKEHEPDRVAVPRFNGRLVLRCKVVDPRTLIRMGLEAEGASDPVEGVIDAAIAGLLAAADGAETDNGDDLEIALSADAPGGWLALAKFLELPTGVEGAQTDGEALRLVFDDEADIVQTASQLKRFQQLAAQKIGTTTVGNSEAAS